MIRRITMLAMAVGAVAAVVGPGIASATKLTMPSSTLVPVGTAITGTANNGTTRLQLETETFGTVECESFMFNGQITKNNGSTVESKSTEGSTSSGCLAEGETPVTVDGLELLKLSSTEVGAETGTGTYSAHMTLHFIPLITCTFSTGGATGVFHFRTNTDKLILTPTFLSSSCGTATLSGEVTLETENGGGAVTLS